MNIRADTPRPQSLAEILSSIGASAAFASHFSIEADPQLHVEDIGEVLLPVSAHTVHRLCTVAQLAQHDDESQTRLDRHVCNTWEIAASQLRFDSPQWPSTLARALDCISRDLGLPHGTPLDAQLHKLLIYAPGQCLATHQDAESSDGMLVITLPSHFCGGELVVSHRGQTLRSRGSASTLDLIAFYADCRHEVRSVTEGYRVALTYNLIARDGLRVEHVCTPREIDALADAVRTFWHTPAASRWVGNRATEEPPDRLVYLLDHEYTPNGLSWNHLRGVDSARAAALRQVAGQLNAEIFLAFAEMHETWSAEDGSKVPRRHWKARNGDDGDGLTDDHAAGLELIELIDRDIELRHWIAANGSRMESDNNGVDHTELCFTGNASDCTPFQTDYEGYPGNVGKMIDRWYHRAAVVMWPRQRAFVIRARLSPRWAIEQIADRLEHGDTAQALQWAQALLPFWKQATGSDGGALLDTTLAVCAALDDEPTAAVLLAPFLLEQLTPDMAPSLLRLLERHGLSWCEERLRQWSETHWIDGEQHSNWLAQTLPALTHAWSHAADVSGVELAAALAKNRWNWLRQYLARMQADPYSKDSARVQAMVAVSPALWALIRASHDIHDERLRQQVIDTLLSADLPLQVPLDMLHAASAEVPAAADFGLAPVQAYCVQALAGRLAQPPRTENDCSITPPADCVRIPELGETLVRFLSSPTQQRLEWLLAEDKQQTIRQFIDRHELPVQHETRRSSRPYILVLEKLPTLFEREMAERQFWASELAWLQRAADRQ
jgi:hypothetical protein